MTITRLNHAVLYVRGVDRSVAFYRDLLGFRAVEALVGIPGAAFLQAPGSAKRPRPRPVPDRCRGWRLAGRSQHGRPVPPRAGGRHPR